MSDVEENTFIYALIDPRDGIIKYVGKSNNPKERLRGHLKNCKVTVTLKNRWVAKLKSLNMKPIIRILEEVPMSEWEDSERRWIKEMQDRGCLLKNGDRGGKGRASFVTSEETKRKISRSIRALNRKVTDETRRKISVANTGRKRTEAAKEKIRQSALGRTHTLESRQKMSRTRKGVSKPRGFGEKISKAHKGKIVSEETRRKISEVRKASGWRPSLEMIEIQRQKCSGEGNGRAKLSENDVRAIRKEYAKGDVSISHLSRQYNVNWTAIKNVITRKTWKVVE